MTNNLVRPGFWFIEGTICIIFLLGELNLETRYSTLGTKSKSLTLLANDVQDLVGYPLSLEKETDRR